MEEKSQKLVTVAEFTDLMTAHTVAQRLIAAGIDATVVGGSSPYPPLSIIDPIQVMVLEENESQALELLSESEQ